MDLINDLGYSHTTVLGYRSSFETRGYMQRVSVIIVSAILIKLKWNDKCTIGDLLWGLFLVVLSPASLIVIIIVELIDSGFFKKSL